MRTNADFPAGWYRSSAWTRYWFFAAGASLLCTTFILRIYFEPQTNPARIAFAAAFAVSAGILSMSFLRKSR